MQPDATDRRRGLVLALLLAVYTFNFVDRQIVGVLAGPIKAELALSDKQLGLLGGLAFAALFSILGVPLGWLADRTGRVRVIAISLAVWSGFTALCGMAGGFAQLLIYRAGVGVGEAGGTAPSYALIAETFPLERRARATALYQLGIPFGSAIGVLLGGLIASRANWRTAFIVVGLTGVVATPAFWLLMRRRESRRDATMPDPLTGVMRRLSQSRTFWLLGIGAGTASMVGYGYGFWLPSLFQRTYGLDLRQASHSFAVLLLVGGSVGILAGGLLADRLGRADRAAFARVPAFGFIAAVPFYAVGLMSHSPSAALLLFLVPQALAYMWLPAVLTAAQHIVPNSMRATAAAGLMLIVNLLGLGFGSFAIGALSDALVPRYGADALRLAMLGSLSLYLVAAVLLLFGAPGLRREWND